MRVKILHILPSLGIGGTEKTLLELCRGLNARGFDNRVVALKSGGETADKLRAAGIPVTVLGSPDGFLPGVLALPSLYSKLKKTIRAESPDVVHTWLTRANVFGRCAARASGVQKIVSSLRVMEREKGYHLLTERWTQSPARAITVNSTALRDFAVKDIGLPAEKIRLIFNGIDTVPKTLDPKKLEEFRKNWTQPGKITVGAVGRLHRQKGMDLLLSAAKLILEKDAGVRFLIAGDGPERENLKAQAAHLGIQNSVAFCGWVKDSAEFYSILDVFVLPSRWEGMPNAVMEAMLYEKPIIATQVGGVLDLITPLKEGWVVQPGDVTGLAEAMESAISDESKRKNRSARAAEKIRKEFDLKQMISAYKNLYETIR